VGEREAYTPCLLIDARVLVWGSCMEQKPFAPPCNMTPDDPVLASCQIQKLQHRPLFSVRIPTVSFALRPEHKSGFGSNHPKRWGILRAPKKGNAQILGSRGKLGGQEFDSPDSPAEFSGLSRISLLP